MVGQLFSGRFYGEQSFFHGVFFGQSHYYSNHIDVIRRIVLWTKTNMDFESKTVQYCLAKNNEFYLISIAG